MIYLRYVPNFERGPADSTKTKILSTNLMLGRSMS